MRRDNPTEEVQSGALREGPLALSLGAIHDEMAPLVGGKALNLGRLLGHGFPVPEGFCLTTAAYRRAALPGALDPLVERLAVVASSELDRLSRLAALIRQAILSTPIPAEVAAALARAYDELGWPAPAVAVRSSATAEDLPGASFAGQQDSFLNVVGAVHLADAVRRCWASVWSDRAVAYRTGRGIDHRGVAIGVVVQRLVPARASGVLFTANPISGSRRQAVVDATPGLGEALVSGAVVPDHFVVGSEGASLVEERLGSKAVVSRPLPEGGTRTAPEDRFHPGACISQDELSEIVAAGRSIAEDFGSPQDVEWAIDEEGKVWIVQARPITTLFPLPAGAPSSAADLRVYYSVNASQGMERPFTPLGGTLFRLLVSSVTACFGFPPAEPSAGPAFLTEAAGRLYLDVTKALRSTIGRKLLLQMVGGVQARAAASLARLAREPGFSITYRSPLPFVRRALSFLLRSRLSLYLLQSIAHPEGARLRIRRLRVEIEDAAARLEPLPVEERPSAVERLFSPETTLRLLGIMPSVLLPSMILLSLARRLLRGAATEEEIETSLRALPANPTTQMDLALWALAVLARRDERLALRLRSAPAESLAREYRAGGLPDFFARALDEFLRLHGHRCASELDAGLPRWSEEPAPLFEVIAGYLRHGEAIERPDELFGSAGRRAEAMVAELAGRARGAGASALVRFCLERVRALSGLQEVPRSYIALLFAHARRLLEPVGRALVTAGLLAEDADLAFLSLPEIRWALRGNRVAELIRERKTAYAAEVARRGHPAVLLSDGTIPEAEAPGEGSPGDAGLLQGIPASRGSYAGKARVILDPAGALLLPGEILVAPSTDPGWTPLFLIAGALVMETGGAMAHGAIVAREYGIPAVVGVVGATTRIAWGQELIVDGTNGTVRIVAFPG